MDEKSHKSKRLQERESRLSQKRAKSSRGSCIVWERRDVSTCTCSELTYRHSHCPCESCNGKAVSSSTEYNHWEKNIILASGNSTDKDDEVSDCGSRSDLSSEDEDHVINPGSCSGEVVSDTDSNGSRFDDGEDRGEDLCDSGGESDDGTDGGGGGGGDDGGCSVNNDDKDRNLKK
ncbi:hypothetical protein ABFA07_021841 [Porites harrisoni]